MADDPLADQTGGYDEKCQIALDLERQRRELIEERWVATHVLALHII